MRKHSVLVLLLIFALACWHTEAQELKITTNAANTVSSKSLIDLPGLTGNPLAIIVATPMGNTEMLNTNPIGAWYYSGKWNIFNSNHSVMPLGATYMIRFYLQPGPNQFMHRVTKENTGAEGSYIDNPALNNNPGAQVTILQNYAPEVRSPYNLNRFPSTVSYSTAASRWYIANVSGDPLSPNTVFNAVVGSGSGNPSAPVPTPAPPVPMVTPSTPNPTPSGNSTATPPPTPIGAATPRSPGPVVPASTPTPATTPVPLNGFVDMHTHPMSHLGFGKRLLHGVPDGSMGADGRPNGSIIPRGTRNCNPTDIRASNIFDALGNCSSTHGGWGLTDNPCGDHIRALVLNRMFDKDFKFRLPGNLFGGGNLIGDHEHQGMESIPEQLRYWPSQTSKIHQQMWWEWIKRAKEQGNLRVMIALTVNSELLANILNGDEPKDDKGSADLQIDEIKSFVGRHNDFMEVAYSPADLRRIVGAGKLAVILGMEVDNIGNFNKPGAVVTQATVKAEIQRLHTKGIRYVFPIHLVNNKFGGTAVYEDLFNFSNKYSTGSFFTVNESDKVGFRLGEMSDIGVLLSTSRDLRPVLDGLAGVPYPPAFNADPTSPDFCMHPLNPFSGSLGCFKTFKLLKGIINPPSEYQMYSTIPNGHVNDAGLTGLGKYAITEMMKLGLLIDIDHMSDRSQADTLEIAERPTNKYPLNIGHNGIRKPGASERHALRATVERIAKLGGVFGIGTADSEEHHSDAKSFITSFNEVWSVMGHDGGSPRVAMGTDVNGMERLPRATSGLSASSFYSDHFFDDIPDNQEENFQQCRTGTRTWDYTLLGVAHYGLIADFVRDIRKRDLFVQQHLMESAEYFAQMWEKADLQKTSIQ